MFNGKLLSEKRNWSTQRKDLIQITGHKQLLMNEIDKKMKINCSEEALPLECNDVKNYGDNIR